MMPLDPLESEGFELAGADEDAVELVAGSLLVDDEQETRAKTMSSANSLTATE